MTKNSFMAEETFRGTSLMYSWKQSSEKILQNIFTQGKSYVMKGLITFIKL